MRKIITAIAFVSMFFLYALPVYAIPIDSPDLNVWGSLNPTTFSVISGTDHGDAVGYKDATNERGRWQGLGINNYEDNGVQWSVGGSTFGTDADLIIGQEVTFKFLFWQLNNGHHPYDQIYAAFDYGQDSDFDYQDDTILYQQIFTDNPAEINDSDRTNSVYQEITLSIIIPETMEVGSTWLRARATCWHVPWPEFNAYIFANQGETEDYELKIIAAPVPEPATMLLFGIGLLGLAGVARRKR